MNIIECTDLTKKYGRHQVLDQLSLTINENKMTGLVGRNGAGKTTLLKLISGFIHPTSGTIEVFSENPFNNLRVSANSIFIDDQMGLPPALTLKEILEEAGRFYEKWDEKLAEGLFDYFSFNPNFHHGNLSKGMKSTFNMILGLASRCALTIFDEPTTGMDAAVRKDFYRALLKDYLAHPRTIIVSSHHLSEIEDVLEDVLLINNGKVRLHLSVSDLKEWAIGLTGKMSAVAKWSENKEIIHEKEAGPGRTFTVVKNDFSEEQINQMKLDGIKVSQVSASDVCVYLTSRQKGGIDDVFNRNEFV
ncbi:ABC transporter [Siminovitchia terrae]|uniref:ABC transporter ATP-binding protein n=1 Tax=Siminovitchia terrae TaxID=1914933 RepID=UPI001B03AB4D|nr:ABC transporter ATP-binding protein [Siminovitchia terrae]GIN92306.1 ABC transporter [Siminovitchia terrae]